MEKYQTLLYYKYTPIEDPELFRKEHLNFCKDIGLVGRILVGKEGINGTVSGTHEQCKLYMDTLRSLKPFAEIEFKIDDVDEPSFKKMYVRHREEIVSFGFPELDPNEQTGIYLSAKEFLQMKDEDDVILVDTRNRIEHEIGKFHGAYTLDIDHFRDLPEKTEELEKFREKKIIMYCTGGIRCEKATAFMLKRGFEKVYQLEGGIIKYGKLAGGKDFDGKCYVFDNRLTVDVNSVNPVTISHCAICQKESIRMVNCANPLCNEHFVLCEDCGWEMKGCCSKECMENPESRKYDGKGYYAKQNNG